VGVLEEVASLRGKPQTIRVDNGPEFILRSLDLWAYSVAVKLDFSRQGKPTENTFIESFNGRLRDECLNQHWFLSLAEARAVTEAWRDDYNRVRPHGALGNQTPFEFARLTTRLAPSRGRRQFPQFSHEHWYRNREGFTLGVQTAAIMLMQWPLRRRSDDHLHVSTAIVEKVKQ